jgi:hypothetical protein
MRLSGASSSAGMSCIRSLSPVTVFEKLGTPERQIILIWLARLRQQLGEPAFEQLLQEALGGD